MWEQYPVECKGGLVTNLLKIQQGLAAPGSAFKLTNFEPMKNSGYRRVNGYAKFDSAVVPSADDTTQLLGIGFLDGMVIVPREGKIYSSIGSGWTEIATGRTQTTKHRYALVNLNGTRKIIGTDGSNYPYSYDKSSFVNINSNSDIQGATSCVQYQDQVFYFKGNLVSVSEPFNEAAFNPANGAFNFNVQSEITGAIVFNEVLYIFTKDSITTCSGTSFADFNIRPLTAKVGCLHRDTIQEISGDVMFFSADGLRLLSTVLNIGALGNTIASNKVYEEVQKFSKESAQFSSLLIRGKSQYRVFAWNGDFESNTASGFLCTQQGPASPDTLSWAYLKGFKVYGAVSEVYSGDEYVLFISDTEYVYKMDVGDTFDGEAITSNFFTPYLSINSPITRKTFYKVTCFFYAESTVEGQLSLNFDLGSSEKLQPEALPVTFKASGGTWGTAIWGDAIWGAGVTDTVVVYTEGAGKNVSFQFTFKETSFPFVIDTIVIEYSTESTN